ncbi:MAG: signal peptide peptidase SppA [Oscillochloris sp.]|nr:signal peptide peptidase SppA [Oscillochloris sp.]
MSELPPQPTPSPAPPQSGRGWLIALAIVIGLVLSCAILPLGAFALLLGSAGGSAGTTVGPLPAPRWEEQMVSGSGLDRIVIIEVAGVIGAAADPFSLTVSQDQLLSQIEQATEDPLVKAVVLRVDSPGGGVVASSELHSALSELAAEKPLVVSMGATAASGGYYIAMAAERIYANPDTLTGSLGVILSLTNYGEAFDRLGLRSYVYKSGELKDIGSPTREPTAEEAAVLQSVVNEAYEGFVTVIIEGRGLDRDRVLELADGRIYTGSQALEVGLIDALGNLDAAIDGALELADLENALIVRYTESTSLRALLLSRLQAPAAPADPLGLRQITEPAPPRLEYRWMQ